MHALAQSPRHAADGSRDTLESIIVAVGPLTGQPRTGLTTALVLYWQALANHDLATRRDWLAVTRANVRRGATAERAFELFALGDIDEDIVLDAVTEFIGTHPVSVERRQAAVAQAVDWIRRGLALNRSAVFSALLACGDPAIDESLAGLRLILHSEEVEAVCRRATRHPTAATRAFLSEWLAVLDACAQCDADARGSVAMAVAVMEG